MFHVFTLQECKKILITPALGAPTATINLLDNNATDYLNTFSSHPTIDKPSMFQAFVVEVQEKIFTQPENLPFSLDSGPPVATIIPLDDIATERPKLSSFLTPEMGDPSIVVIFSLVLLMLLIR